MLVGAVYAAVPVDKTVKSRIENFKSQTVAKKNLEEALPTPSMMEFDIEEDSINEEQLLQRILSRVNTLKPHGRQQWKARILPTTKHLSRTRKSIFGIDNRNKVETSVKAQTYPYSTVVSLSSGCTGTLIGVQHVLTAAHCVHDGRRFLRQARNLRIGKCPPSYAHLVYSKTTIYFYLI
jgi:V8-like Glu-specific endopeptidase